MAQVVVVGPHDDDLLTPTTFDTRAAVATTSTVPSTRTEGSSTERGA
jgi:hypothetical protein